MQRVIILPIFFNQNREITIVFQKVICKVQRIRMRLAAWIQIFLEKGISARVYMINQKSNSQEASM
jgi:hypothetical protein